MTVSSGPVESEVRVQSPVIDDQGRVTFRLQAPRASEVLLQREDIWRAPVALNRGPEGIWAITSDPLPADVYRYSFVVDGLVVLDPSNPVVAPGVMSANVLEVPGVDTEFLQMRPVPHGEVHVKWLLSTISGKMIRVHVYTPPNYERGDDHYPVLYLLHGDSDDDSTWFSSVGRAALILDNLIAAREVRPMLIVCPQVHACFEEQLLADVIPMIQARFRTLQRVADVSARAIVGKSNSALDALSIALRRPGVFGYVCAFSPIGLGQLVHAYRTITPEINSQIKMLWIGVGIDDRAAIQPARAVRQMLISKRIEHIYSEVPGKHTFLMWRRFLRQVLPLLFH